MNRYFSNQNNLKNDLIVYGSRVVYECLYNLKLIIIQYYPKLLYIYFSQVQLMKKKKFFLNI